jgi:hypothetical protein
MRKEKCADQERPRAHVEKHTRSSLIEQRADRVTSCRGKELAAAQRVPASHGLHSNVSHKKKNNTKNNREQKMKAITYFKKMQTDYKT